jgi:anti-anti-sigma factor
MSVSGYVCGEAAVLEVNGKLTCLEAGDVLERTVDGLGRHGVRTILANLVSVSAMDGVGLGALVSAYRASIRQRITFRLVHVPSRIRRLIVITGLAVLLEGRDSLDAGSGASRAASSMTCEACVSAHI